MSVTVMAGRFKVAIAAGTGIPDSYHSGVQSSEAGCSIRGIAIRVAGEQPQSASSSEDGQHPIFQVGLLPSGGCG